MAEQTPKLQVPKEDIVKKETKALTALTGGLSPKLEDLLGKAGGLKSTREVMPLRGEVVKGQLEAQGREAQVASELPVQQAQLKGEYAQKEAQAYEQADLTRRQQTAANPIPEFNPTQDNLMTLATMASLIAVVGNVVGQQGGLSGLGAINAMTGMMKGYQSGRKDVFDREKAKFEADLKTLKAKQEQIMKDFDLAVKKIPYDLAEAKADMEVAIARAGSPLLRATYEKQGYDAVLKLLDANAKDMAHIENMALKVNLAATKGGGGFLKPSAKIGEGYMSLNILSNDLKGLQNDLKNDVLQKQLRQYRIESFLTEEGKVLDQLLGSQIPPELSTFLTKVRDIRNNYYLDISGKAVTGGEALRNYGTVPQPGDTPERMQTKIQGMEGRVNEKIRQTQFMYGLPQVPDNAIAPGTKTSLVPGQNYQQEETMPVISTKEQYNQLPSGTEYYEMDASGQKQKFRKP
jgi:hypothetical protein